ncbi:uncharacterized protein LOC117675526 [Pantherophis guttatus]|uniref:Uncharacterized protein LOC117675526 n=1 Tax=Pantherophis guttatus TaxID=94885 RepID=A0A6P9D3A1_PANGU|nr:uncharacterized protein LOC117675526 [Pantherophis guttatus]
MAASGPPNLFVGEMGARELPNLHLPGSRVEQTSSVTWQQDTAGNWTRLEGSATRSETTSRGAEAQPVTTLRVTNPSKTAGNQQHLHRELLFTHRKGLSLRSKPELLQVLEHRNRRRDGTESGLKPSPLEQELLRWQQRREQHQQQEATGDPGGSQPEFVKVREKLRSTQQRDPSPQHASPSLISVPFPRLHHPNRKPSQFPVKHPPVALQAAASHPLSSLKASSLPSVPSKHSLANNT